MKDLPLKFYPLNTEGPACVACMVLGAVHGNRQGWAQQALGALHHSLATCTAWERDPRVGSQPPRSPLQMEDLLVGKMENKHKDTRAFLTVTELLKTTQEA